MYQNILQSQNIWKYSYIKDSEETKTQYIHDVVSRSARTSYRRPVDADLFRCCVPVEKDKDNCNQIIENLILKLKVRHCVKYQNFT